MRLGIHTKEFVRKHRVVLANLSYISILQLVLLAAPLITYPYLVRILGRELYGMVLTAQMLVSYASLIIDFGSNNVCAKHVSLHRDNNVKLSEIVSSVLCVRVLLWCCAFFVYIGIVWLVPAYRAYWVLFLISYGLTIQELLFPQYFFQGIEQMKYITIVHTIIRVTFIVLVFVAVKQETDYLYFPVLYTIGYLLGGIYALHLIFNKMRVRFYVPSFKTMLFYVKDASPLLATDLICTIKDKINYLFVGAFVGMGEVVIYDLGLRLNGLLNKPTNILSTVLLPRFAQTKNLRAAKNVITWSLIVNVLLYAGVNLVLPYLVEFFIHEPIDVLPIRILLLGPVILSVSAMICYIVFIAMGYNTYVLKSIVATTIVYLVALGIAFMGGYKHELYTYVIVAVIAYAAELFYRLWAVKKIRLSIK
ncbi:MAG: oligosaccharide flippase family protein [Alistipes sp.]|nr:oligosaccharide flippase family protein [Alistipes sp.]